jgi:hypothetical protein
MRIYSLRRALAAADACITHAAGRGYDRKNIAVRIFVSVSCGFRFLLRHSTATSNWQLSMKAAFTQRFFLADEFLADG